MRENEAEARKTLMGIIRLVKKIKEMKVQKEVRDMVLGSVERLEKVSYASPLESSSDICERLLADISRWRKLKIPFKPSYYREML